MVTLKAVTAENYWDIVSLSVRQEQSELVASNAVSIGQAYVQPELVPLAVYAGDTPVGFLMYCIDRDDGEYWIYRMMTDHRYQGKGYAKDALRQLIKKLQADKTRRKILLGVDRRGDAAVRLYQSCGFRFTGQVFGKEHIMCLEYGTNGG
ncbi:MAG: GNAT family N-acetyltransferase [Clostridiales bacterium]|nr:GNAT family N-acetyltransferase [Clostridiales bacterium]